MESFEQLVSVAGGLLLSVACGLLLEELIFGGLVRLFFAPQRSAGGEGKERATKDGGKPCLH